MFAMLPPDIRHIIALREQQRDHELRRLQSKVARELELRQTNGADTKIVHTEPERQANEVSQ